MSGWAQFAEGGNFMSYGPNLRDASRRLAFFVDRILKGAKPAELPVELPTRVELVVNQKAARALGVKVPQAVLLRADRVIE
jgi:putative ABC transport system substrate-binding protein